MQTKLKGKWQTENGYLNKHETKGYNLNLKNSYKTVMPPTCQVLMAKGKKRQFTLEIQIAKKDNGMQRKIIFLLTKLTDNFKLLL